jgi:hypothetical protein
MGAGQKKAGPEGPAQKHRELCQEETNNENSPDLFRVSAPAGADLRVRIRDVFRAQCACAPMRSEPAALPLPARAGGLQRPHT